MRRMILLLAVGLIGTTCLVGCVPKQPRVHAMNAAQKGKARVVRGQAAVAQPREVDAEQAIVAEKPAPTRGIAWQVKGWGRNQTEAEADAAHKAASALADFLQHLNPPLVITPTPAYVRDRLIRGPAQRLPELDQDIDKGNDTIKMQCWSVSLVVTPEDYAELSRREKQFHTERERSERMLLAARVLAGLMVLLASVVGLVRLKEWTRCTRAARTVRVNKDGAKVKALVVACVVILAIVVGFLFLGFSTEFPPPPH